MNTDLSKNRSNRLIFLKIRIDFQFNFTYDKKHNNTRKITLKRLFSTEVDMIKQAGKRFNLNYYNELKNGQLRMVMIEENLADKGILPIINTLLSDPKIGPRLYLIVVKGDFDKYIMSELKQSENFDFYLYQTLRHFERANQGE